MALLTLAVPAAFAGYWTGNVTASMLGAPFSTDFSVSSPAADGSVYIRNMGDQLFRVGDGDTQYCFMYNTPFAFQAPFELVATSDDEMTFCWRGERLPSHTLNCSSCSCAEWKLTLQNDTIQSTYKMSPPAIHAKMEFIRTGPAPDANSVRDGWDCNIGNSAGPVSDVQPMNCPLQRSLKRAPSTISSRGGKPSTIFSSKGGKKHCLQLNLGPDVRMEYEASTLPCMPCDVTFKFQANTPNARMYFALGFKDQGRGYFNSSMTGDIPNYLGMATDATANRSELSGRIFAAHGEDSCFRRMRATGYVGELVDAEDDGKVLNTEVTQINGVTTVKFMMSVHLGVDEVDIDWQRGSFGLNRFMWAIGSLQSQDCNAPLTYHGDDRALAPLFFPGFASAYECDAMLDSDVAFV